LQRLSFSQNHFRQGSMFLLTNHFRAAGCDKHYSTNPLRDIKSDNNQADDVPGAVSQMPSELCLVSGKYTKICSCSCCTEERARKNAVLTTSSAVGDESKRDDNKAIHNSKTNDVADDVQKLGSETLAAAPQKKPGLLRRFHLMYKQYGVVMFCVHWSLASVWTGMFYYAAIRLVKL
jgi:hypothetical protein